MRFFVCSCLVASLFISPSPVAVVAPTGNSAYTDSGKADADFPFQGEYVGEITQDLATVRDGGNATDLLDRLRLQVGRLDIAPEELEGRNRRSALFKTMFLAFRDAGARDWRSNLAIALDHRGSTHKLQFHHIFPKALLKSHYTSREADDIANLAFIGGRTNRQISDKDPRKYFPGLIE